MIVALLLGEGLRNLALIVLMGQVLADGRLMMLAYRACSGLQVRPSLVRWATSRNVLVFGGKTLIPSVSQLLLDQTASIFIVAYLGPAALALFARPRSLLHHVDTMVRKMAMVLIPTASSLQSMGNVKEIQGLLIKAVQYSCCMVLPVVAILAVYGDVIMGLWMGPDYANAVVLAILALGFLTNMAQQPLRMILAGMNAHGRAGIGELVASLCSVAATLVMLGVIHWGLVGVALAMTIPLTIMNLLYLPFLARQRTGIGLRRYCLSTAVRPVICVLPFLVCLIVARYVFAEKPFVALLLGVATGTLILFILYWRSVVPRRMKSQVLRNLGIKVAVASGRT
jgi:O-antigen/teichoic acid export membrane protein